MTPSDPEREARTREDGLLILSSATFDADMDYVRRAGLRGVECNRMFGFEDTDLARLASYRIDALNVVSSPFGGPGPIEAMTWLKDLRLSTDHPVDLRNHLELESVNLDWHARTRLPPELPALRSLALRGYKPPSQDLSDLPSAPRLGELHLAKGTLRSLAGLDRFAQLTVLGLYYQRSLAGIAPVQALVHLEEATFENCPALTGYAALGGATSLRRLGIRSCAPVPSLAFLRSLPRLQELDLWGTPVQDGDMAPATAVEHVNFQDRKHYTHTLEAVRGEWERRRRAKMGIPSGPFEGSGGSSP